MDRTHIIGLIATEIRDILPELSDQSIGPDDLMADLGLDSIERSEVVLTVLEKMNLKVPMTRVHGPANIGELADLLANLHGAA